jgi:hypothetical protein
VPVFIFFIRTIAKELKDRPSFQGTAVVRKRRQEQSALYGEAAIKHMLRYL